MTFPDRFANRRAVITGGAAGIGLAIAQRLSAEGAVLSLWDRDVAALVAARNTLGAPSNHDQAVDVTDAAGIATAADRTAEALGGIDILVLSAGITGPNGPAWEYGLDDWRRVMDINVNGVYYCARAVIPHMLTGGYGRIVPIASVAGKEGNPNAAAYSASKAAVIGLTKSLGKELADTGVRVNCVTPAAVRTGLFEQMSEAQIAFMLGKIPMGRFGGVEEVAALVAWLASEECSFSTGGVFDISGGRATY